MLHKFFIILCILCVIIFIEEYTTSANPVTGRRIRHPNPNEYLFAAAIARVNRQNSSLIKKICGGSFISRKDVLTAAHCLENETLSYTEVIGGSIDFTHGSRMNLIWWLSYNSWATEMRIRIEFSLNDIAVLRLRKRISDPTTYLSITKLKNSEYYGKTATMVSWTAANFSVIPTVLDLGDVRILSNDQCNMRRRRFNDSVQVDVRFLCSSITPYILLDMGDSGSPLVYGDKIIGINNGLYPPTPEIVPEEKLNIHIGIEYYRKFIKSTLKIK